MISPDIVSSLDGVSNDAGNIDLIPGSNITITPNDGANTITIAASVSGGDNLGNHTATQNVTLNSNWLSGDGQNEGVFVSNLGNVGVGTSSPSTSTRLHVSSPNIYAGYFSSNNLNSSTRVVYGEFLGSGNYDVSAIYGKSTPATNWGYGGYFEGGYMAVRGTTQSGGAYGGYFAGGGTGVYGSGSTYGVYGTATSGSSRYGVYGIATGGSSPYGVYGSGSGGIETSYAVYAAGNLAYTGSLINASDAKFKDQVNDLSNALDIIVNLDAKSYIYSENPQFTHMNFPSGKHYGFIAQEIEQILPELVVDAMHPSRRESQTKIEKEKGVKELAPAIPYKGINYVELIPVLVQAMKEQQILINNQQKELEELRGMIENLIRN
jgi:hypothetical protein